MKKALLLLAFFGFLLSVSAEHKLGKKITGKIVDSAGKEVKTDLSKKKYLVFYFTASW